VEVISLGSFQSPDHKLEVAKYILWQSTVLFPEILDKSQIPECETVGHPSMNPCTKPYHNQYDSNIGT
jgi:hypothetical protein